MKNEKGQLSVELWKKDIFLSKIDLSKYKVVSFDIFDTLLFRGCEKPSDIFVEAGIRGESRGLLYKGIDAYGFWRVRQTAAGRAHKQAFEITGCHEVTLETIYSYIPENLLDCQAMLQLELEVEREYSYINPSILSLLKEAKRLGLKVVLTSDMYLSKAQLFELLGSNGLDNNLIDELFVSSEHQGNKASGRLFERMLEGLKITSNEVIHVGDNMSADIKGAELVGITSCFYNVIPPQYNTVYEFEAIRHAPLLTELLSLRKLAGALKADYTEENQFWYEFGATVLGPFLTLFTEWVIDTAEHERINHIHPFMREGNFLAEMLRNIVQNRELNITISELFVSRVSTYFASINQFRENEMNRYFMRINATIGGLFTALDLKQKYPQYEQYYDVLIKNADNIQLEKSTLYESLVEFILSREIQQHINEKITQNKILIQNYLEQEITSNALTVDLGYRGTIQRSLFDILSTKGSQKKMIHLVALGTGFNVNHLLDGLDIRAFGGMFGEDEEIIRTITRSPETLEQSIMRADGTTIGYRQELGVVVPVQGKNSLTQEEISKKNLIQSGILEFQKLFFYLKKNKLNLVNRVISKPEEARRIIHRYIDFPRYVEASYLGELSHDDNFGKLGYTQICSPQNLELMSTMDLETYYQTSKFAHIFPSDYWPQGLITQSDPTYLLRKHINAADKKGYFIEMTKLVQQAKNQKLNEVIVYGAGEAGTVLIGAIKQFNIRAIAVVDRNSALWGSQINDVPVMSLAEAMQLHNDRYLVGSFAFAQEIKKDILTAYRGLDPQPIIITV